MKRIERENEKVVSNPTRVRTHDNQAKRDGCGWCMTEMSEKEGEREREREREKEKERERESRKNRIRKNGMTI